MLTVLAVVLLLVMVSVMLHYEALLHVSSLIKRLQINSRLRVVYGVMGALIAHVSEVMVFAFGYYFLIPYGQYGTLVGKFSGEFRDCAYFSFATYTSLGYGDITPFGHLRLMAGMEVLTGLVLISWTASFMFIQMQRFWGEQ
jgi:hypothetical protein